MLRNRMPEIEIPEDNPFQLDKLKRELRANTFLSIINFSERYDNVLYV